MYQRAPTVLLALLFLGITTAVHAQGRVRITEVAALDMMVDLAHDSLARAGLQACGLTEEGITAVLQGARPEHWPPGLRTDSARVANGAMAANYTAERACTYNDANGTKVIVRIPMAANFHMPDHMRAQADFHLVLDGEAVRDVLLTDAERPKPSKGPSYRNMAKAKITRPDRVYATYDLGSDEKALKVLANKGMSQAEIDAVVFRSTERNWPDGLDSFTERYPQLAQLKKMKAFHAAQWDGKVLVVIPAELNRKLPPRLRPYLDIYMVFEEQAVVVEKRK